MRRVRILLSILFYLPPPWSLKSRFLWSASAFAPRSCHIWITRTHDFLTLSTDFLKMGVPTFPEYSQTTELPCFSYRQRLYSRFLTKRKIPRHCRGILYKDRIALSKTRNCDVVLCHTSVLRLFRNTLRSVSCRCISRPRLRYSYTRG